MLILLLFLFNLLCASDSDDENSSRNRSLIVLTDDRLQSHINGLLHLLDDAERIEHTTNVPRGLYSRDFTQILRDYRSLSSEEASEVRGSFIARWNESLTPLFANLSPASIQREAIPYINSFIHETAQQLVQQPAVNSLLRQLDEGMLFEFDQEGIQNILSNNQDIYEGTPVRTSLSQELFDESPLAPNEDLVIEGLLMNAAMNIFATPQHGQMQRIHQLQQLLNQNQPVLPEEPLAPNDDLVIPVIPGLARVVVAGLATPPQRQALRRLLPGSPLVIPVPQEVVQRLVSPQGAQAPLPQTGIVRQREETEAERRQQEPNARRRRLDLDTPPADQFQFHRRDDENGPDGGGVPA